MRIRSTFAGLAVAAAMLLASCAPNPNETGSNASEGAFTLPTPQHFYDLGLSPDRSSFPVSDVRVPGVVDPPPGSGYARYFEQQVTWTPCGGFECANILAPMNWHDPDGLAITLALKRRPATAEPRLGSLFINPGGPGGSAQNYVELYPHTGLEQYDIVGLDPRGSGESTPGECGSTEQIDAYFELDFSPDDEVERQALIDGAREFAKQCRENSGALLDHISGIEVVYDFDMVRQLLGDEKFNFHGVSYGTYLGSVYAELYPENVGYLVLDAATNITDRSFDDIQEDSSEVALNKWFEWYAENSPSKMLGSTPDAVKAALVAWFDDLDANPIPVGDRVLNQSLAIVGLICLLYFSADADVAQVLEGAIANGDGEYILAAADAMNGRGEDGWGQPGPAFPGIACLDFGDEGIEETFTSWEEYAAQSPFLGYNMGINVVCVVWSAVPAPQIDFSGAGAPPIVVIGGTGDESTPYRYAEWMAEELESAVLVTRNGAGHGSYGAGSSCVDKLVVDYLANGVVPDSGTVCEMD